MSALSDPWHTLVVSMDGEERDVELQHPEVCRPRTCPPDCEGQAGPFPCHWHDGYGCRTETQVSYLDTDELEIGSHWVRGVTHPPSYPWWEWDEELEFGKDEVAA